MTDVLSLVKKREALNAKAPAAGSSEANDSFVCSDDGVWHFGYDQHGVPRPGAWICAKLEVVALCREFDGNGWGYVLSFSDPRGHAKQWVLPARLLAGDGAEFRAALLSMGLQVSGKASARARLSEYIQTRKPTATARITDRIGWQPDGAFVLPDRTIGEGDEGIIFQSDGAGSKAFLQRGNESEWRAEIDRPAMPARAATMEITASRKKPQEQSARIIYDDKGKATGRNAPAAASSPKGKVKKD